LSHAVAVVIARIYEEGAAKTKTETETDTDTDTAADSDSSSLSQNATLEQLNQFFEGIEKSCARGDPERLRPQFRRIIGRIEPTQSELEVMKHFLKISDS
jgi:tRNA C32,U32 (ribose-2'-O)-methylase TrmJ